MPNIQHDICYTNIDFRIQGKFDKYRGLQFNTFSISVMTRVYIAKYGNEC